MCGGPGEVFCAVGFNFEQMALLAQGVVISPPFEIRGAQLSPSASAHRPLVPTAYLLALLSTLGLPDIHFIFSLRCIWSVCTILPDCAS